MGIIKFARVQKARNPKNELKQINVISDLLYSFEFIDFESTFLRKIIDIEKRSVARASGVEIIPILFANLYKINKGTIFKKF